MNTGLPKIEINPAIKTSRGTLVEAVLLAVIIGLGIWFLILPKRAELAGQAARLAQLREERRSLDANLETLKTLVAELKKHPQDIAKLDEALPLNGKIMSLNILLENLANSAGVTVGDIAVSGKNDAVLAGNRALLANPYAVKRSLQKFSVSASVVGTLDQLLVFIKKLETYGRVMDINDLEISSPEEGKFGLKLNMESYYYE